MEDDIKKLKACMVNNDYYSMLIYITIIIEKYTGENRAFLTKIIENIKTANYQAVNNLLN